MLEWTAREGISRFIVIVLVAGSAAGCVSGASPRPTSLWQANHCQIQEPRHLIWEGYTCQAGRGWLPFTFELPEPLGDRTLKYRMMPENQDIDVGVVVLP
jgi:hypothetical protein